MMHNLTSLKKVVVGGAKKGEVYRRYGTWRWLRGEGGAQQETYGPRATLADVRDHIARVCRVQVRAVRFVKPGGEN